YLPSNFGDTIYVRLTSSDGKSVRGDYSNDGVTWHSAGQPRASLGTGQRVGVYSLHGSGQPGVSAPFDWFALAPEAQGECEPENTAPTVTASADVTSGPAPLTVALTAEGADADGDTLSYTWDLG